MDKFRQMLQESFKKPRLNAASIYNFGYLAYIFQTDALTRPKEFIIKEELNLLKSRYLEDVSDLCVRQLEKYVCRRRTDRTEHGDPIFDVEKISKMDKTSLDRMVFIDSAMNSTFRSDMRRRNVVWNRVTKHLVKLAKSRNNKDMITWIDRLNNDIHNTRNSIFEKFPNGAELVRAFDVIHNARTPGVFKRKVKSSITQIEGM